MKDHCMAPIQNKQAHFWKGAIKSKHLKIRKLRYLLNLYLISSGR